MQTLSNPTSALNVCESPKFSRPLGNLGRGNTMVTSDFRPKVKSENTAVSRMGNEKHAI